jgi:hypothetical protein
MAQHRKYMKMARDKTKMEPVVYKNYYEVLGLGRNASLDEIKRGYHGLALKHHPDRNRGKKKSTLAAAEWAVIPAAYSTLSYKESKAQYDEEMPLRDALIAFYNLHNPSKLCHDTVENTIENWKGREVELFECLNDKYEIKAFEGQELSHLEDIDIIAQDEPQNGCCNFCCTWCCCCFSWCFTAKKEPTFYADDLYEDDIQEGVEMQDLDDSIEDSSGLVGQLDLSIDDSLDIDVHAGLELGDLDMDINGTDLASPGLRRRGGLDEDLDLDSIGEDMHLLEIEKLIAAPGSRAHF